MTKGVPDVPRVRMTPIDRAIAVVSPRWARNRIKARFQTALLAPESRSDGLDGPRNGRRRGWSALDGWRPRVTSPNDQLPIEAEDERARSRELIDTDPIAGGAIHANVGHVVGTGLSMRPTLNARRLGLSDAQAKALENEITERWEMWASSPHCDVGDRLDFYEQQALAFRSTYASGDVFAVLASTSAPNWPYRLAVQLIEGDRISNPGNGHDKPGELIAGIELDRSGRAVRYHICDRHPGDRRAGTASWTTVDARGARTGRRNILHLYEMRRPEEVRGRPHLSPVIGVLKQLTRYTEAELSAAVTSASLTVFVRMAHEAFSDLFNDEDQERYLDGSRRWDGTVKPSTAINLLPGEDVVVPDSKRPNANFDPFFLAMVRQVGVGIDIPFEVLIKHFTSSYSASRAAMMDAYRTFRRRRDWLAKRFCQPIYEEWLAEEVARGTISAPGFFADPMTRWAWCQAKWIGDGPGSLDPLKEINAAVARMEAGISTLEDESILHDGIGWERKHAQRIVEVNARRAAQLQPNLEQPTTAAPNPAARPDDDASDDQAGDDDA